MLRPSPGVQPENTIGARQVGQLMAGSAFHPVPALPIRTTFDSLGMQVAILPLKKWDVSHRMAVHVARVHEDRVRCQECVAIPGLIGLTRHLGSFGLVLQW
jgi:hypothetical protein